MKVFTLSRLLLIVLIACFADKVGRTDEPTDYVVFSINVQDFAHPDESVKTLRRIADLHSQYRVPVDFYLTTTMVDILQERGADLYMLSKYSDLHSFSYHVRPPTPYYTRFDWLGMRGMTVDEQQAVVRRYETHGLDLTTGETTSAIGGFQKLSNILGHPPVAVSAQSDGPLTQTVAEVYKELGAQMFAVHGRPPNFGDRRNGVPLRPEHFDLKLFQHPGEEASTVIENAIAEAHRVPSARSPYFIGIKMHDNDFIAERSAWLNAFMDRNRRPPWDLSQPARLKSQADRDAQWKLYESAISYVASQRPRLRAVGAKEVLKMLDPGAESTPNANRDANPKSEPSLAVSNSNDSPLLYVSATMHIESRRQTWPDPDAFIQFFQRATQAGRHPNQQTGMRWSVGADIGWLDNEPRAREVILVTEKLGVQWDVHAHQIVDRAHCAALMKAWGAHPTSVASGLIVHEIDPMRLPVIGRHGEVWQAEIIWGLVKFARHGLDSDDFAIGVWRPKSNDEFTTHDPNGKLIAVGGSRLNLAEIEQLANELANNNTGPAVMQATIMLPPSTLLLRGTNDGIDAIETWANRLAAIPTVRWATIEETARAWVASGGVSSRTVLQPKDAALDGPPRFRQRPVP